MPWRSGRVAASARRARNVRKILEGLARSRRDFPPLNSPACRRMTVSFSATQPAASPKTPVTMTRHFHASPRPSGMPVRVSILSSKRKIYETIKDRFTQAFFDERKAHGDKSTRPVFIVGMPRSGTTLTEQILARHTAIAGGRASGYTAHRRVPGERGIAPRPVFCVIGHAYRDRGVADDACRGTFTFAGETVDLGPTPTGSARRCRRTASGGSSGRSSTSAWTSRTRTTRPATRLSRDVAAARGLLPAPGPARRGPRRHLRRRRPPGPELGLRVGGLRRRARVREAACRLRPRTAGRDRRPQRRTSATTSPPSATTARSSSTR